jgi:hypothetical protein
METETLSSKHSPQHHSDYHPQTGPEVTIMLNGQQKPIHRGSYQVSELKAAIGVDATQELDQVIDGHLTPLNDNDRIVIKGAEAFISHVRCGGSS